MISRKQKDIPRQARRQAPTAEGGKATLIAEVGKATQAFQRSTDAFDDAVAEDLRLNRTDLRCLDWLTAGPTTAGQLAAATGLSTAATTTLVDRLEGRGLVQRVRDATDRRKVVVEMTARGWTETGRYYAPLAEEGARMLARYSDEQLSIMRDHLIAATELIDRARVRLRASAKT